MLLYVVFFTFLGFVSAVPNPAKFSPSHLDHVVPRNVTPLCLSHSTHWMSQLRQGKPWALRMLDAMTKFPSGLLLGGRDHLGNFDQCVNVEIYENEIKFQGQYFKAMSLIEIPGTLGLNMSNAFCIPSTCHPEEIPFLMQEYVGPALGIDIKIWNVSPLDCYTKFSLSTLPRDAIIVTVLLSILVGGVVISAIVELQLGEKTPALVRACSLTNTCRALFKTRKHPADISCLHGLRVGSILWIILGHGYGNQSLLPTSNLDLFLTYFQNPLTMTIVNSMPSVDTFFFLSGFLICISFLNELKKRQTFDVIKFYIYRYIRLAVPMGIVILVYLTILPLIGTGPLWNNYFYDQCIRCKANWWTNMVFVNNYIFTKGVWACIDQTWYTGVDMQLAWLSPLVLLPMYHSPRAGLQLMTLVILISCFIPFTVTYIYHFPMSYLQVPVDIPMEGVPEGNMDIMIYNATQSRATPYLVGILLGYYMSKNRNRKFNISKCLIYIGWTCSTVVALVVIYSLSIPHQPGYVYNLVGSAFYAGFHHLAWSAVIAWIVFACVNGFGGIVDAILSWNKLLPLSRLTFSVFLMHGIIITYKISTTRVVSHFTDFDGVHDYFGYLIPVYFLSFWLYVCVEGPLLSLLRIAFSKGRTNNS